VVKVGQIVKVKVLSADAKAKRIALSMKALQGAAPPAPKPQKQKPTLDDQLSALSTRFRVR